MPSTCEQLDLFATYLASTGNITSPGTISNYLSAVRTINRLHSYPAPPPTDPQIRLTINGIRREMKHQKKAKRPFTVEMRNKIF